MGKQDLFLKRGAFGLSGETTRKIARTRVLTTMILITLLVGAALFTAVRIEQIVEENCFKLLKETAMQGATDTNLIFKSAERQMEMNAAVLTDHSVLNAETFELYIDTFENDSMLAYYSVLLPDGQMIYSKSAKSLRTTPLVFEDEAAKGEAFTSVCREMSSGEFAVYQIPVVKDSVPAGVLYGYVDLKELSELMDFSFFDGKCQLYLLDGVTGDFLMDTWHDELQNIYTSDLSHRKMKKGTSTEAAWDDIANGRDSYLVFTSKTTGDDFYLYFYPVGIYNLSFQVTVSRSVAFAEANEIRGYVYILGAAELLFVLIYTLVYVSRERKQTKRSRRGTVMSHSVAHIQQALLNAYEDPSLLTSSLAAFKDAIEAEKAVLLLIDGDTVERIFASPALSQTQKAAYLGEKLDSEVMERLSALDASESHVVMESGENLSIVAKLPEMEGISLKNFIGAYARSGEGKIVGLIYAANVGEAEFGSSAADILANSFYLAVKAADSYLQLHQMGEVDLMTGLKNRNAYQKELPQYKKAKNYERLCCIYVDANGLHDLNNNYGHASGDAMLKAIASSLRELFGFENTYRVGGDEFVILEENTDEGRVASKLMLLHESLNSRDYYVSVGFAFGAENVPFKEFLETAETRMYEEKRIFYSDGRSGRGTARRARELEELIASKRDSDSFIKTISADYLGVYIVDLDTDAVRAILHSEYSDEMMTGERRYFTGVAAHYIETMAAKEYRDRLANFLDISNIKKKLESEETIFCTYMRNDGIFVRLRVMKADTYTQGRRETIWIFERYRR